VLISAAARRIALGGVLRQAVKCCYPCEREYALWYLTHGRASLADSLLLTVLLLVIQTRL